MGSKSELLVEADSITYTLRGDDVLTFGRDASCTVRLGAGDAGVSRTAGRIRFAAGGWSITNLSRKRPLHIADANGFIVPLPVAANGWPPSRRAVDQPRMTVLVPGDTYTYALTLHASATDLPGEETTPAAHDPLTTRVPVLQLTDNRREVLVAMARGFLRPYPDYDPRPEGYDEIATLLGLTRTQVTRRIEDIRNALIAAGVDGMDGVRDARRTLCEWLLAMRLIVPADLDWLALRTAAAAPPAGSATAGPGGSATASPAGLAAALSRQGSPTPPAGLDAALAGRGSAGQAIEAEMVRADVVGPSTTQFARQPAVRVARAAHAAATSIAPVLRKHLHARHGDQWLDTVNASRRARGLPAGRSLADDRFCLAVFRDQQLASDDVSAAAAALKSLADSAAHNRPLGRDAPDVARQYAERLQRWAAGQ